MTPDIDCVSGLVYHLQNSIPSFLARGQYERSLRLFDALRVGPKDLGLRLAGGPLETIMAAWHPARFCNRVGIEVKREHVRQFDVHEILPREIHDARDVRRFLMGLMSTKEGGRGQDESAKAFIVADSSYAR